MVVYIFSRYICLFRYDRFEDKFVVFNNDENVFTSNSSSFVFCLIATLKKK